MVLNAGFQSHLLGFGINRICCSIYEGKFLCLTLFTASWKAGLWSLSQFGSYQMMFAASEILFSSGAIVAAQCV